MNNESQYKNMHRNTQSLALLLLICTLCFLVAGCGPTPQQQTFAQKAKAKVAECQSIGDKPVTRLGKCLVWNLDGNSTYPAQDGLDSSIQYSKGDGPVTVFLVSDKRSEQMGTYSVSKEPAYRQWVDVCVVQFSSTNDSGTATATHEVVSLDPRQSRPVQYSPEYGDPVPKVVEWISALPTK
jgi:hypothetical protein